MLAYSAYEDIELLVGALLGFREAAEAFVCASPLVHENVNEARNDIGEGEDLSIMP